MIVEARPEVCNRFLRTVWGTVSASDAQASFATKHWGDGTGRWEEFPLVDPLNFDLPTARDLYFAPRLFNRGRRSNGNAVPSDWLYADLDHVDPRSLPVGLRPTFAWETSPGRYQAMWRLDRPVGGEDFNRLNKALTYAIGADKGGWAASKLLRVPGSVSHKHGSPFRVKLVEGFKSRARVARVDDLRLLLADASDVGRGDAAPTDVDPFEVVRARHETALTPLARDLLDREVDIGDRSSRLWKLHCTLADLGIPFRDAFVLARGARSNKFATRNDGDQWLWKEMLKARRGDTSDESRGRRSGLRTRPADLSRARRPRFAWRRRLVLGELNLVLGAEGVGKGTLAAAVLSALTRGCLPGDLHGQPVSVAIVGDEDSFDDVWVPRLHAARADLGRVHLIEHSSGELINFVRDRDALRRQVEEHQVRLVYFDQLLDNLGTGVDDYRGKSVREALQPLRGIARDVNVAAIGSLHPNKRGTSYRDLVSGSVAFNALSRSSLLLGQHPTDPTRRVLARGKGNLSQAPRPLEFKIVEHEFAANGETFRVPRAVGFRASTITVDDLMSGGTSQAASGTLSKRRLATAIIDALLPRDGAWCPVGLIYAECAAQDIGDRLARDAAQDLGIETRKTGTFPASVEWRRRQAGDAPSGPSSRSSRSSRSAAPKADRSAARAARPDDRRTRRPK